MLFVIEFTIAKWFSLIPSRLGPGAVLCWRTSFAARCVANAFIPGRSQLLTSRHASKIDPVGQVKLVCLVGFKQFFFGGAGYCASMTLTIFADDNSSDMLRTLDIFNTVFCFRQ
jgi:hypothetical protein